MAASICRQQFGFNRPQRLRRWDNGPLYELSPDIQLPTGDFTVRLSRLQVQYVFSSTLSLSHLIQYDNISENLGINVRLHWIPEAGREGFVVFNHNLVDTDQDGSFRSSSADLSVKFSYTFRF